MVQFYYWRKFAELSPGPVVDLGSHQLDALNWFLGARPNRVLAVGGKWWSQKIAEKEEVGYTPTQLDHTLATLTWPGSPGPLHGQYSVKYSTSAGSFYEQVHGDGATLTASELRELSKVHNESHADQAPDSEQLDEYKSGRHLTDEMVRQFGWGTDPWGLRSSRTSQPDAAKEIRLEKRWELMEKAVHAPHLANFFGAVRGEETLNCPPETGFAALVSALKTHEAAVTGEPIEITDADYAL